MTLAPQHQPCEPIAVLLEASLKDPAAKRLQDMSLPMAAAYNPKAVESAWSRSAWPPPSGHVGAKGSRAVFRMGIELCFGILILAHWSPSAGCKPTGTKLCRSLVRCCVRAPKAHVGVSAKQGSASSCQALYGCGVGSRISASTQVTALPGSSTHSRLGL